MVSLRALFLLLASSLLLAACAPSPIVQLYPGAQRPDNQVLTVRVPTQLDVFTINGKQVDGVDTFFSTAHKDLKLTPGRYEIIAYYKELWNLDADNHEIMKSDPVKFIVDGKAGDFFRLNYNRPQNPDQARKLADNFSGWTENVATGEKTPTQSAGLVLQRGILAPITGTQVESTAKNDVAPKPQHSVAPIDPATPPGAASVQNSNPDTVAPAPQPGAGPKAASAGSYLDTLKAQWNQATPKERRAFLKWISDSK